MQTVVVTPEFTYAVYIAGFMRIVTMNEELLLTSGGVAECAYDHIEAFR